MENADVAVRDSQYGHDRLMDEIADFAATHQLDQHVLVLEKAALLLDTDTMGLEGLSPEEQHYLDLEISSRWSQPRQLYFTIVVCSFGAIMQRWSRTGAN